MADGLTCPECGKTFPWDGSGGPGLNPHYNRARHIEREHLGGREWVAGRTLQGETPRRIGSYEGQEAKRDDDHWYHFSSVFEQNNASARFNKKHNAFFQAEAEEAIARNKARRGEAATDTKRAAKVEKLQTMAKRGTPGEQQAAKHILFKRFGVR